MKTNLTDLMQKVASLEKEKRMVYNKIYNNHMNKKTIELNGQEQSLIEVKDFDENLERYNELVDIISLFKDIIEQKNAIIDRDPNGGLSIKELIIANKYLSEQYELYINLATEKESKRRISETNNSYFEVNIPAYNVDEAKEKAQQIQKRILDNETAIINLNSKEFEIDDKIINSFKYYKLN